MLDERLRRWEQIFYIILLVLALVSRFYMLGERAISHDESIHTKFAWNLYAGQGFQHNPMMHGPLLFEVTAFMYFLFGVSDFTARIYTSLAGVALVMTPLLFRKWLGRKGAAVATALLLISPSISYYSRYIRHDAPVMLFAVLWIWTLFKYLDVGESRYLYWMAAFFSLMHATKEVNYIYIAIVGALFFLPFAWQVMRTKWQRADLFFIFTFVLIAALLLGAVFVFSFMGAQIEQRDLDEAGNTQMADVTIPWWGRVAAALAFLSLFSALILVYYGVGIQVMQQIRLFDVLMAFGSLTLPLGSAFLIRFVAGIDMGAIYDAVRTGNFGSLTPSTVAGILSVVSFSLLASVMLGLWWDKQRWPVIALIHYAIFFVTYTTVFTWGFGALSGLVGSLAYWLAQQGVERGSQPWYYYLLVGPMYEYLPILFSAGAGLGSIVYAFKNRRDLSGETERKGPPVLHLKAYFPLFLLGWTVLAWLAYTYAGEKMPWLLVHIALPSIFLAAWGLDRLLESLHFQWEHHAGEMRQSVLFLVAVPLALTALLVFVRAFRVFSARMAMGVSTSGPTLEQLQPFGQLLGSLVGVLLFGGGVVWLVLHLSILRAVRLVFLELALFLGILTLRTMVLFNFVNYDMATEHLVYAHGAPGIKVALAQIQDISWRVTGSAHNVKVAYSEDGSWPFTWYMVDYPNNYFYGTSPDQAQLLECPVIIAGSPQYGVVEDIVGTEYVHFDYKYLWWPIEDYKGLTLSRVREVLRDADMRAALWDIFWQREYTRYARLKNPETPFTLQTWPYRKEFRLYVRKHLAQEVWGYRLGTEGVQAVTPQATQVPDPYAAGQRLLAVDSLATLATAAPRGFAVADDGSLYVADTALHRVWHITAQGAVLDTFGEYGTGAGQFNEPWDVALDAAGHVYVADTWNHRIQKFAPDGTYLASWGTLAQVTAFDPAGQGMFFGPRGIAIGPEDEVFVTDTGNKRVQVFDVQGNFLREFGGWGREASQMDEPVGIAVDAEGLVFVADTWNGRVQVFDRYGTFLRLWDIPTWHVDNPEEKPFLSVKDGRVYVSDPSRRRVLAFDIEGAFQWAVSGGDDGMLTFPVGVAVSGDVLYVADTYVGQVVGFELPE